MPEIPPFPAPLVIEVVRALQADGVPAYVSGGWAVDALLGSQTQAHPRLDLAVEESGRSDAACVLAGLGFRPDPPAFDPAELARLDRVLVVPD